MSPPALSVTCLTDKYDDIGGEEKSLKLTLIETLSQCIGTNFFEYSLTYEYDCLKEPIDSSL